MSNTTKNHKIGIFAIFVATALVASVVTFGDNMAFADHKKTGNQGQQIDEQGQYVSQGAQCVSGEAIIFACNNLGIQSQNNEGNNALGQQ
jgi:hypothetical protein